MEREQNRQYENNRFSRYDLWGTRSEILPLFVAYTCLASIEITMECVLPLVWDADWFTLNGRDSMMLTGCALSIVLATTTAVLPRESVEDHSQPMHWTQPVVRTFERHEEDLDRRTAWEGYNRELVDLWKDYRKAGSTPRAWRTYKKAAAQAKRRYIFGDLYYKPIIEPLHFKP